MKGAYGEKGVVKTVFARPEETGSKEGGGVERGCGEERVGWVGCSRSTKSIWMDGLSIKWERYPLCVGV